MNGETIDYRALVEEYANERERLESALSRIFHLTEDIKYLSKLDAQQGFERLHELGVNIKARFVFAAGKSDVPVYVKTYDWSEQNGCEAVFVSEDGTKRSCFSVEKIEEFLASGMLKKVEAEQELKRGSQEFYEIMAQFEKVIKKLPYYIPGVTREKRENWPIGGGNYYQEGITNAFFMAYLSGYQYRKALEAFNA